jgi:hypothetical protein
MEAFQVNATGRLLAVMTPDERRLVAASLQGAMQRDPDGPLWRLWSALWDDLADADVAEAELRAEIDECY